MADTAVAITAGSGTSIDTRTEGTNGNHRQVIVIGDPATNAGVAPVDATTGLSVNVTNASLTVASHAVTNAGTFATQIDGAALTALQLIDDTVVAQGTALGSTKNSLIGGSVTTSAPTYTTGQISPLNLDTAGNLRVNVAAGGAAGGTSSTVGAAAPATATAVGFSDGTNMALGRVKAASTAAVAADPSIVVAISPNGQLAAGQAAMASSNPVAIASDQSAIPMVGSIAHDSADGGNPVKIGFKSTTSLSALTPVATAERTDAFAGTDGVQIVRPDTNLEDISVQAISCTSGANTSALAAAGASIKWYVKGVIIFNNGASNGSLLLTDGSGGSTKAKVPFPASTGTVVTFPLPIAFTANTAVFADPSGSDTIDVTIFGFKSKV